MDITLCDPGKVRSHTDARAPRYLEGGLALSSFCPLLHVSAALVSYPLIETHPFRAPLCYVNQTSTSVQQPLHPVFEIAEVAVTFPGVVS